jgi:hypothetical protein
MKGALLVGDAAPAGLPAVTGTHLLGGGLVAAALSPLALWAVMVLRGTDGGSPGSGRIYYPTDATAGGLEATQTDESRSV